MHAVKFEPDAEDPLDPVAPGEVLLFFEPQAPSSRPAAAIDAITTVPRS
jgi:hypothetical protein